MYRKDRKIAIDCDDAADELKKILYDHLKAKKVDIEDLAYKAANKEAQYPDIGYNLAVKIKEKKFDRGILLCGTGIGMAIIANKVNGVYAGVCHDVYSAERIRKSNDAQIITLGSKVIGSELAKKIIDVWLESEFAGGRSKPKVERLRALEGKNL